jgi:hypothetical protein
VAVCLGALSASAVFFFASHGWLFYYGDAEAHLNIARRVVDSRTPGFDQLGTVWLPLQHVLMLPLVRDDALWRGGLAGAIPSALCFVAAGVFLFAATRRLFGSHAAAAAATALMALNPNLLYLQSIPMTEPVFLVCLMALLYFTVRFRETERAVWVVAAGVAACAATLTRYEGWFLLPFVALWLAVIRKRGAAAAFLFSAIAVAGPLYCLASNWYLTGDALDFLRGPYSARAIQGAALYPGKGDWRLAWLYYRTAAGLCAGPGLALVGVAGAAAALVKRAFWPVLLLALPGVFYIWSLHSSGTPIFMPGLWPHSYYNTRYGLAVLPLLAVGAAGLVALAPRWRPLVAMLAVAAGSLHWFLHPDPTNWITFEESRVNSAARREWTGQAAAYLAPRYLAGAGVWTSFGDLTGIYRAAGIPLRETFTGDNGLPWLVAVRRPELFVWQQWAVAMAGDAVDTAVAPEHSGGLYRLEKSIEVKGAPAIHIYRRAGGVHGTS